MTSNEDEVLELTALHERIEKELGDIRGVVAGASNELEGARINLHRSKERLETLVSALRFMKDEADIVSLSEYQKVKRLFEDNKDLVNQYETISNTAKTRGANAADAVKRLVQQLNDVEEALSSYGKILTLPQREVIVDEENTDDDDE
jgi:archaellum component FlaC